MSPDPVAGRSLRRWVLRALHVSLALGFLFALIERQWLNAAATLAILGLMFAPALLERQTRVRIPPGFEALTLVFVYAALFLGEVRGYYERFWWWDIALHASSGLLLGLVGFLLVYVLNENERVDLHLRPRFLALFAFLFAVAVGTSWEIFEFGMDRLFGMNMQKPMFDDPSGLTDTMWDLILDTAGAFCISLLGWWYMHREEPGFFQRWIRDLVRRNPQMFGRRR